MNTPGTLAAAALLALTATAMGGSQASASPETAVQLAAVPEHCADFRTDLRTLNMTEDQFAALAVCDALELGDAVRPLRAADVVWDIPCMTEQGWDLNRASNVPVPPPALSRALDAGDLGPCGTLALSEADCTALREQLSPGGQPSAIVAVVLNTLGCDVSIVASGS